jgi:hypothetical protein
VVLKPQIAFESKAQADEKAQHTSEYASILKRPATQLSGARWGFETTSNQLSNEPNGHGVPIVLSIIGFDTGNDDNNQAE